MGVFASSTTSMQVFVPKLKSLGSRSLLKLGFLIIPLKNEFTISNFNRILSKKYSIRGWRLCLVSAQMSGKAAKAHAKPRHCLVLAIAPPFHNRLTYFIFFSSSFSLTARPKSPSLNSMSALRKKLPTLMSRCMTR